MHNPSHLGKILRAWVEGAKLIVTLLAGHIDARAPHGRTLSTAMRAYLEK